MSVKNNFPDNYHNACASQKPWSLKWAHLPKSTHFIILIFSPTQIYKHHTPSLLFTNSTQISYTSTFHFSPSLEKHCFCEYGHGEGCMRGCNVDGCSECTYDGAGHFMRRSESENAGTVPILLEERWSAFSRVL